MTPQGEVALRLLNGLLQKLKNNETVDTQTQVNIIALAIDNQVNDVFTRVVTQNLCFTPEVAMGVIEQYPHLAHGWLERIDLGPDFLEKYNHIPNLNEPRYTSAQFELMRTATRREWLQVHERTVLNNTLRCSRDKELIIDVLYALYAQSKTNATTLDELEKLDSRHALHRDDVIYSNDLLTLPEKVEIYFADPLTEKISPAQTAVELLVETDFLLTTHANADKIVVQQILEYVNLNTFFEMVLHRHASQLEKVVKCLNETQIESVRSYAQSQVDKLPTTVLCSVVRSGLVPISHLPARLLTSSEKVVSVWDTYYPLNAHLVEHVIQSNMDATELTLFTELVAGDTLNTIEQINQAVTQAAQQ